MVFKTPAEQLRAYGLLVSDLSGAPVYWLHMAEIYGEVPGRPVMLLARAQTCAIIRAETEGRNILRTHYKEAGLYLAPEEDRLLAEFKNPVTGKVAPMETSFREGPSLFSFTATDKGVFGNTEMDQKTVRLMPWTWHATGPNVWMVNEDAGVWKAADPTAKEVQAREPLAGRILQTWHAEARDLIDPKAATAPCFKNYMVTTSAWPSWTGDPGELGSTFVRGMGAKLTPAQADAYPEIARLKRAHPDFFVETGRSA